MNYVTSRILEFITDQAVISHEKDVQDFYRYGIEISISSLLNIIIVVAVGLLIHCVWESIIFLALFIIIRSFTGGYHADTYFRCNLLMCVTFILTVLVNYKISNMITVPVIVFLICFTEITVCIFGPIENKNKPIDDSKKVKLKIFGVLITLIINCGGFLAIGNYWGTMIVLTCFLIAILMILAKIKEIDNSKTPSRNTKSNTQ